LIAKIIVQFAQSAVPEVKVAHGIAVDRIPMIICGAVGDCLVSWREITGLLFKQAWFSNWGCLFIEF